MFARCSHAGDSAHPRTSPEVCARMRPGLVRIRLRGGPTLNPWFLLPIVLLRAVLTFLAGSSFSESCNCYNDESKSGILCLYVRAELLLRSSTLSPMSRNRLNLGAALAKAAFCCSCPGILIPAICADKHEHKLGSRSSDYAQLRNVRRQQLQSFLADSMRKILFLKLSSRMGNSSCLDAVGS